MLDDKQKVKPVTIDTDICCIDHKWDSRASTIREEDIACEEKE